MNIAKRILIAIVAVITTAGAATAQFAIGPRLGMEVNSMRFDKTIFDSENRAGFTGGVQVEFTVPIINLGFDASVMYVHRNVQGAADLNAGKEVLGVLTDKSFRNRDYIEIPINFKYKLNLPVVGKFVVPYAFTGPSFAFLCSKKAITEAYKNKSVDIAWNFGIGLQFFSHLQIGASYGLGMTKLVETVSDINGTVIDGKNNYWTVTAAWLF